MLFNFKHSHTNCLITYEMQPLCCNSFQYAVMLQYKNNK